MSELAADANPQERPTDSPPNEDDRRYFARALAVAFGLWVAGPVVGNLLGAVPVVAVVVRAGGLPDALPAWALLSGQVLVDGTYLVVGVVYARRWLSGVDWRLPRGAERRWVGLGLAGSLAVWAGSTVLSRVLAVEPPTSTVTTAFGEPWALAAFVVLAVTFVPVAEEALFRGAIQRRLRRTVGAPAAIGVATLAFLSVHVFNFSGGSPLALGIVFGTLASVSAILGYCYERTDTLAVPVVVHVGYNAVVFGVAFSGLV